MKKYFSILIKVLKWATILFLGTSIFFVILYSFVNPPITPLMVKRMAQQKSEGKETKCLQKWTPIEKISKDVVLAVVASEDNKFADHFGIDLEAIEKAKEHNKKSKRKWGASTITQQTAKNVFLWPSRTWIRKGFELYFTTLIELIWSKKRIMEVYLNVIEMGNGIYGIGAASEVYYRKKPLQLNRSESAMIAAILPNPIKRNPVQPTPYLIKRQQRIIKIMNQIGTVNF